MATGADTDLTAAPTGEDKDPAQDLTLDDLGTEKELNTPPDVELEAGPDGNPPDEEPEPEAEPEKKQDAGKKPAAAPQDAAEAEKQKTNDDILKYLGMESPLKIKGKDYKLGDFSKDDILAYIQKGVRMTQVGQELSAREKQLLEREKLVEQGATKVTDLIAHIRAGKPIPGVTPASAQVEVEPPKEFLPSDMDTEDTRAIKAASLATWKQNQSLAQRLQAVESGLQSRQTDEEGEKFMRELTTLKQDYPLASVEEVIAVHTLRPGMPLTELVRKSDEIYGSVEHVEQVFKHRPEVRKHFDEMAVKNYLARRTRAGVMPQKPTAAAGKVVPAAPKKPISMEEAGRLARQFIARKALEEGEES